jgi:hypothetical protein
MDITFKNPFPEVLLRGVLLNMMGRRWQDGSEQNRQEYGIAKLVIDIIETLMGRTGERNKTIRPSHGLTRPM